MGVDITFFVETNRYGTWEAEAQFFLPRVIAMFGELSAAGSIRGYGPGTFATPGLPEDVSRKTIIAWGEYDRTTAGYPTHWDRSIISTFEFREFKGAAEHTIYGHFGNFGEAHLDTRAFANSLNAFMEVYEREAPYPLEPDDFPLKLPPEYESVYKYMRQLEKEGVKVRAVYWFDN